MMTSKWLNCPIKPAWNKPEEVTDVFIRDYKRDYMLLTTSADVCLFVTPWGTVQVFQMCAETSGKMWVCQAWGITSSSGGPNLSYILESSTAFKRAGTHKTEGFYLQSSVHSKWQWIHNVTHRGQRHHFYAINDDFHKHPHKSVRTAVNVKHTQVWGALKQANARNTAGLEGIRPCRFTTRTPTYPGDQHSSVETRHIYHNWVDNVVGTALHLGHVDSHEDAFFQGSSLSLGSKPQQDFGFPQTVVSFYYFRLHPTFDSRPLHRKRFLTVGPVSCVGVFILTRTAVLVTVGVPGTAAAWGTWAWAWAAAGAWVWPEAVWTCGAPPCCCWANCWAFCCSARACK